MASSPLLDRQWHRGWICPLHSYMDICLWWHTHFSLCGYEMSCHKHYIGEFDTLYHRTNFFSMLGRSLSSHISEIYSLWKWKSSLNSLLNTCLEMILFISSNTFVWFIFYFSLYLFSQSMFDWPATTLTNWLTVIVYKDILTVDVIFNIICLMIVVYTLWAD